MLASLARLNVDEALIVTGLPVMWWDHRRRLVRSWVGRHEIAWNGKPRTITVHEVRPVWQPFGSFYARFLDQEGRATADDVAGIIELIEPLERDGVLVKRSRELIESEIDYFQVIERDGLIIGCAALYPFGNQGELACLVVHPDYRDSRRGETLLTAVHREATARGLEALFVLTTQSSHWFIEHGFERTTPGSLPDERRTLYNDERNATCLIREI